MIEEKRGEVMNSLIGWIGGKKLLRNQIIEEFSKKFDRYVEVFGGAGWVLFAKDRHAREEIYNDIDGNLVNLFRCVKYHPEALQKELDYCLYSREVFYNSLEEMELKSLTDIQRAARFFLLVKLSFGAKGETFNKRATDLNAKIEDIKEVSERLRRVTIENLSYEKLIASYDSAATLFYLDPPYFCSRKSYIYDFEKEDHDRLKGILEKIKGKFVLSYNDCEEIRELYKDYPIIMIERHSNLTTGTSKSLYKELMIKNFE